MAMSSDSESSANKRRERSPSENKAQASKLFITNIDGKADIAETEKELRHLFEKYGVVSSLVAKRNRNSQYCFAFAEMSDHAAAEECVKAYDQSYLGGKQIKVEFQDDGKRRKDSNKGCYNCGKMGHFARECHSSRMGTDSGRRYHQRSRSQSEDSYRPKKSKKRRSQSSGDRDRSRSPKKSKKLRDEKKKKKHKRHYSSESSR